MSVCVCVGCVGIVRNRIGKSDCGSKEEEVRNQNVCY